MFNIAYDRNNCGQTLVLEVNLAPTEDKLEYN